MHIKLTEYTFHTQKKLLKTITAKLTKGSESPCVFFEIIINIPHQSVIQGTQVFWRRKWQPTVIVLPGESHGQRSWVSYSPWGHKELDMTEAY